MKPEFLVIGGVFLFFAFLEVLFTNFTRKQGQTKSDIVVEIISSTFLPLVVQPTAIGIGYFLASQVLPGIEGTLTTLPFLAVFGLFLVGDDMMQYWWHRLSHSVPLLYNLHRPHHNAEYMSIRIVYRNNLFYYLFMPNLWISGALLFAGAGWVYATYVIIKMTVIFGAHSDVRWDKPLYGIKWLHPVMWVVERTISTPSTHSAHHGKYASDPATHYKGNYGNLLFFWDVLFGTARITRTYPEKIGVENLPETTVAEQLIWPLAHASNDRTKAG